MNPSNKNHSAGNHTEHTGAFRESLIVSLQDILHSYGRSIAYDELAAVTGVSFMAAVAPATPGPAWWPAYGRDAFLVSAARAYGLLLRELHPPDAVPAPPPPPEFTVHFHDSYQPFIAAALERNEPVLAWAGWPEPYHRQWGVITSIDAESRRCIGRTPGAAGDGVTLVGPPIQVYIVQGYNESSLTAEQVLDDALHRAAIILNNRVDAAFGIVTGPAAFQAWRELLQAELSKPSGANAAADLCTGPARAIVAAREAAIRFLEDRSTHANETQTGIIDACLNTFRDLVACLEPVCDADVVCVKWASDQGRTVLIDTITQAADIERRAAEATGAFADP